MFGSVKQKLLIIISALILASVITVTVLTYSNYSIDLVDQSTQNTQQLLLQLGINLDTYIDELFRLCLSPYYNKRVMEQLETTTITPADKLAKRRLIEDYLTEVMTLPRSDILRAHILSDEVYSSSKTRYSADIAKDYKHESWYVKALQTNSAIFLPVNMETQGKTALSVFSFVQRINSTQNSGTALGVIRVDANYNGIKAVCDRAGTDDGSALYIVDSTGNEIYNNNQTGSAKLLSAVMKELEQNAQLTTFNFEIQNAEYLVNIQALNVTDWQIIDIHAMKALTSAATQARNKAYLLAFLCAALSVLITIPLVKQFLKPIFQITDLMRVVQAGNLNVHASIVGHDELAYLARSFNEMIDQINTEIERNNLLTRQVYEARYLEKEAQYVALCNQIRPHFLFNSLNTIQLLIKTNRYDEAVQCIDMLASLLRGMVNSDRDITLSAEMKIVESYLMLQQKRYGNLEFKLPDVSSWENYLLPALTIQPLVENALVHGCEPKRGMKKITLSVQETDNELQITVMDNGMGMNEATIKRLQESLNALTVEPQSEETGVGLVNITRRVKLKFGDQYGLTIVSVYTQGTTVTLHLPLKGGDTCTEL